MNDKKKCPKCRTYDFNNCHSIQCPMRVEYKPITITKMTNEELDRVNKLVEDLNNIVPLKLETLMDVKLCISKAMSENNKPLKHSETIDSLCKEHNLSNHIKHNISFLCKEAYIKGSNNTYDIWVKNK